MPPKTNEEATTLHLAIAKLQMVIDALTRTIQSMEGSRMVLGTPAAEREILLKLSTDDLSHIIDRAVPWYGNVNHAILMLADVRDSMERIYCKSGSDDLLRKLISLHESVEYYIKQIKEERK